MSKRNVSYVKPSETAFLRRIKEQVGYKEGPTVDTKREDLGPVAEEDLRDSQGEEPTIVVLEPGDLTAEQATYEKELIEKLESESPADLTKPIVFKAPTKSTTVVSNKTKIPKRSSTQADHPKPKKLKSTALLSFDTEEDEETED